MSAFSSIARYRSLNAGVWGDFLSKPELSDPSAFLGTDRARWLYVTDQEAIASVVVHFDALTAGQSIRDETGACPAKSLATVLSGYFTRLNCGL